MSLQGPIVIVADTPVAGLVSAFTGAGAFPIIEAGSADAAKAVASINPTAVVVAEAAAIDGKAAQALIQAVAKAKSWVPVIERVPDDGAPLLPGAIPIAADAPPERLIARLSSALRLRVLHSTVRGRARTLKAQRNIVAEMPDGDPLDAATVLVVGRGRAHPTLSVAVGERMGVMGALSIDAAARCLAAREIDGIVIGDGLPLGSIDAFLAVLAKDVRFRDLPVGVLGGEHAAPLANLVHGRDPLLLLARLVPLVRLRAMEAALKRLLKSIECKGMVDPRTGLFHERAFGQELGRAIEDAAERGGALSLARFSFETEVDRRTSMDAARLVARLVRNTDFACRQDDGSVLFVFAETDLKSAHVAARRLASVLKHTMLRPDREQPHVSPAVTLATLKPTDTVITLLARVAPRPVAVAS